MRNFKDKGKSKKEKGKGKKGKVGIAQNRDLEERTFQFAVSSIGFLKNIKYTKENEVIKYQLAKSATSVGANYEEAQGVFSKDDFKYKMSICFREAKESNYWLRLIKATEISRDHKLEELLKESYELKNIFGSIMKKIHRR